MCFIINYNFFNLCNSPIEKKGNMTRNIAPKYANTRNPQSNPEHIITISLFLTPLCMSAISSKRNIFIGQLSINV